MGSKFLSTRNKVKNSYRDDHQIKGFLGDYYDITSYYTRLKIITGHNWLSGRPVEIRTAVSIEVETMLEDVVNKLLIIGAPGVGKSTLLQYICYQWSIGKLWSSKFDILLRVELKDLYSWLREANIEAVSTAFAGEAGIGCRL